MRSSMRVPACRCQLAQVLRRSWTRTSSSPARTLALRQALLLMRVTGRPRQVNTQRGCFPTWSASTAMASGTR